MMRPRGRCPPVSVLQRGQKSGVAEEQKEGEEKQREELTWALNGDAALSGPNSLVAMVFPVNLKTHMCAACCHPAPLPSPPVAGNSYSHNPL